MPRAECVDVADFHTGRNVEQSVREVLHVPWRQPRRAKTNVNFRGSEVCWLHGFQRLDILGISRVGYGCCVRDRQLFTHVAGQILVVGLPLVCLRIEKDDALQVRQKLRHWFVEQVGHVVEVNAAVLVQGDEQRFLRGADRLDRLPVMNCALLEDGGLGRSLCFVVEVLQREQQGQIGIAVEGALIGAKIHRTKASHKTVVSLVESLPRFDNVFLGAAVHL